MAGYSHRQGHQEDVAIGTNKAYEIAKELPRIPIGSQYRFYKSDLIDYLNNSKQ